MVYQRVQRAVAWNSQHDTPIKKQPQKIQSKSAFTPGLSAQERIDSLPDVPANWMSLDPVYRRIQAKAASRQENESYKPNESSAHDSDAKPEKCCIQCEVQNEAQEPVQLYANNETEKSENASHQQVQLEEGGQKSSKSTQNPAAEASANSHIIQSTETQDWIHLADTAIKDKRYQDVLKAYDEGIKLNPNITPSVKRSKLKVLEHYEQIPLSSEREAEDKTQFSIENKTEIAQSNPAAFSNLPPWTERNDSNDESQRQEAIRIVSEKAKWICKIAQEYNVTPDAIAGAILWEGIENPFPAWRTGPLRSNIAGKIHPYPGDVAEKVEKEGRVTPLNSKKPQIGLIGPRSDRLRNPEWAIIYIGAILDRAADIYEASAKSFARKDEQEDKPPRPIYNVRDQAGILGTLYQGGKVEQRSNNFENRRTQKPETVPQMNINEKLGPWISQYRWWIRDLLEKNGCPPQGFAPRQQIGPQRPLNIPIPSPFYPKNS
ncbi:MAG: hypothetical protein RM347_030520 [Nostoc sp. ChiQUE02]|uniref:hypothetical protein n=1 Tax=Nostoc sp. ChiQUE02 TaxID=3075377 RepID=UPI002AD501DA|nr:hypothetical protein [Nostoc sp. ChiQUE02]MDZ8234851.1 hypothetical protein [Nostoc sp. ChiQUE02]